MVPLDHVVDQLENFYPLEPGDSPSNFRATVVNSTTVSLTWSEPLLPNGVITSYTITYNSSGTQILVTIDARADNFLISRLDEFTVYEIFIHASTRIGPGPSASLTVTTNPSCEINLSMHVCIGYVDFTYM